MTKTAIVTGASTGIGKGITELFLSKGINVLMNSVYDINLQKAFNSLGKPKNAVTVSGDVSSTEVRREIIEHALEHFGRIDILVNNAGIFQTKPFLEVTEDDLARFYNINFRATYFLTQAALPHLISGGGGSILNIGSVLVDQAVSGLHTTAPISIKGAIHSFTRQLAAEFGKNHVRVNAIAPGVIRTALQEKMGITDPDSGRTLSILNQIGHPANIASIAYEVVTNEFITGEVINVDGGHLAAR